MKATQNVSVVVIHSKSHFIATTMARTKKTAAAATAGTVASTSAAAAPTSAATAVPSAGPSAAAAPTTTPRPKVTLSEPVRAQIIEYILQNHHDLFHQKWSPSHKKKTWKKVFDFSKRCTLFQTLIFVRKFNFSKTFFKFYFDLCSRL